MKLTAAIVSLFLLAAPATASHIGNLVFNGTTSGDIGVDVSYVAEELFVDDIFFSELSMLLILEGDGSFDPLDAPFSTLLYFGPGLETLGGELIDVAYGGSSIEALFKTTIDEFAGQPWGPFVLAEITLPSPGIDWSGGVDLTDLGDFLEPTSATAVLSGVSAIPVPATLPLLLGAIALGAGLRMARR